MTGNLAIFDPDAPARIFAAAQDDLDWGIAWCILNEGMHPTQIVRLKSSDIKGNWLMWKRVKNEKPRQAPVLPEDRIRLESFLAMQKPTRKTIWVRTVAMCRRAGYDATPRELRKTAIINWLRLYKDRKDTMDLISARAGCSKEVLAQHYLSLTQWEEAGKPSERSKS